jgi:hypothetical protein
MTAVPVDQKLCDDRHTTQQRQIDALFEAVKDINVALSMRLPLWATLLIGLLMAIIGWLAKAVL